MVAGLFGVVEKLLAKGQLWMLLPIARGDIKLSGLLSFDGLNRVEDL